jgi:hypothetical protein
MDAILNGEIVNYHRAREKIKAAFTDHASLAAARITRAPTGI